jgi:hypothetical protein
VKSLGDFGGIYGSNSVDYRLFNDAFNIDGGMNNELERNRKEVSGIGLIEARSKDFPGLTEEYHKNLSRYDQCRGKDSNRAPTEYKFRV